MNFLYPAMTKKEKACFQCGTILNIASLYGYTICETCKSRIGLFKSDTIDRHVASYKKGVYKEEVDSRLTLMEKQYIKKRIKLLHIQDYLNSKG